MAFEITSPTDEYTLKAYTDARNKVRDIISYGVYPHINQALEAYDELDALLVVLAAGTANQQALATYHGTLMTDIATEVTDLRANAAAVITNIETIETEQEGTFTIELPVVE